MVEKKARVNYINSHHNPCWQPRELDQHTMSVLEQVLWVGKAGEILRVGERESGVAKRLLEAGGNSGCSHCHTLNAAGSTTIHGDMALLPPAVGGDHKTCSYVHA